MMKISKHQNAKKKIKISSLHQPVIETGVSAWKAPMLPLHHWCLMRIVSEVVENLIYISMYTIIGTRSRDFRSRHTLFVTRNNYIIVLCNSSSDNNNNKHQ